MTEHDNSPHASVMEYRVASLEMSVGEIRQAIKSIDLSLQTLSRLDAHLLTVLSEQKDHEERLRQLEAEMPTVKLTRGWVISGVTGVVALLLTVVVQLALGVGSI